MSWEDMLEVNLGSERSRAVTPEEFQEAFPEDTREFFVKLFHSFNTNGKAVTLADLRERLQRLDSLPEEEKLRFILEIQVDDESGLATLQDLQISLRIWALSNKVTDHVIEYKYIDFMLETLRLSLFLEDEGGLVGIGEILREVNESQILSLLTRLKEHSPTESLKSSFLTSHLSVFLHIFTWKYLRYNRRKVLFVLVYTLVNISLVVCSVCAYWGHSCLVLIARSTGKCLHFHTALSAILMLRHGLTHLRTTRLAKYLPIDQHVLLHKLVGAMIVVFSFTHAVCHSLNAAFVCSNSTNSLPSYLLTTSSRVGYFFGTAYPTGWLLLVIITAMALSSLVCVRKTHFQIFYIVHRLYTVFLVCLLLHTPDFWKWILVPGLVLMIEKVWCSDVSKSLLYYKSSITQASPLPNGVIQITIQRPTRLQFQAGDYVYLQLPAISRFEWHPFTISSPPENKDSFTCHVRTSGDWTRRLAKLLLQSGNPGVKKGRVNTTEQQGTGGTAQYGWERDNPAFEGDVERQEVNIEDGCHGEMDETTTSYAKTRRLYIDGPYGSSTRRLHDADHVILIAAGIGVTPYASVLLSMLDCRNVEPAPTVKKVDLIWINRDAENLKWFEALLSKIKEHQAGHSELQHGPDMKLRLYVTSDPVKTANDPTTGVIYGRPKWEKLFGQFKEEGFRKTKVFFCGPASLALVLKRLCMENHFLFRKEIF